MIMLTSCYYRELHYSFETSHGGVKVDSSYYYLAQVREYRLPKGISRFPDGGVSREIRQLFGLFKTDSIEKTTVLVAKLNDLIGWPVRYSTRLEKNDSYIAIGIINVNLPDTINGIYLFSVKDGSLRKYSGEKSLPSISNQASRIAYCVGNKLVIDDYSSNTTLFSYLLNATPVFISWKNDREILLFYANPFHVKILNLDNGKVSPTDLKYIPNYNQELDATTINRLIRESNPDLKGFLK